ncbi:MAG: endo alpha-1,4 polygalactosaminidase [Solirubrobacterales bacterium]
MTLCARRALLLAIVAGVSAWLTSTPASAELWQPSPDDRWQYQLEGGVSALADSGGIDVEICHQPFTGGACVEPDVFDIDLYVDSRVAGAEGVPNTAAVDAIHARGAHAVCYLSAGTAERFRPDYEKYVSFDRRHGRRLLGNPFSDRFSNESWLDIGIGANRRFVLARMRERTSKCAGAGFDAVEYDVVDAYAQGRRVTGFRVLASAQLRYNRALAKLAHSFGLAAALKNDIGQLGRLEPPFDFAINEQCLQYQECTNNPRPGYRAFLDAGKAVFEVEYRQDPSEFCNDANRLGLSAIQKARDFSLKVDPWVPCR